MNIKNAFYNQYKTKYVAGIAAFIAMFFLYSPDIDPGGRNPLWPNGTLGFFAIYTLFFYALTCRRFWITLVKVFFIAVVFGLCEVVIYGALFPDVELINESIIGAICRYNIFTFMYLNLAIVFTINEYILDKIIMIALKIWRKYK